MKTAFGTITQHMREKAKQSRLDSKAFAEQHLKLDYADMQSWEDLAKKHHVRLPQRHIPCTESKYIKRMCKKLNVELDTFMETTGFSTLKELIDSNPAWTAASMCGLLLEYADEKAYVVLK